MRRARRSVLPRVRGRDMPGMRPRLDSTQVDADTGSAQENMEVQTARLSQPLHALNFHDDAMAVIACLNRVSVWSDDNDGGTLRRVVPVHTKYAAPQYL